MRVAVTGGAGFIGRRVCDRLITEGHLPLVYDTAHGIDITRPTFLDDHVDHVIHLAGLLGTDELFDAPHAAVRVNVDGTLHILEWCRRVGAGFTGITMPVAFNSIYTATKVCATRMATAYHHAHGVPVSHVRAFNVFGPGQAHGEGHPRKIIPAFSAEAWSGEPITIWGDGTQTVDLIHVDDVAKMLVGAMAHGDDAVFDAGCGRELSVRVVAAMVSSMVHSNNPTAVRYEPMRRGEPAGTHICATGEGWDRLGWRPKFNYNDFAETVRSYQPAVVAA